MHARTLYDKFWDSHVVRERGRRHGAALHRPPPGARGHEPAGLRGAEARRPQAVAHRVDRRHGRSQHADQGLGRRASATRSPASQVETLDANIRAHGAKAYFPFRDRRQGIVHVIGPEQGATLPGMTVVCGDSHTSTHGAFAALAFGIGTSEVEHVLATQCLLMKKAKSMQVRVDGAPAGRRDGEGRRARGDRQDRHRRRHRPRDRVRAAARFARSRWRAA